MKTLQSGKVKTLLPLWKTLLCQTQYCSNRRSCH